MNLKNLFLLKVTFFLAFFQVLNSHSAFAQGCSDAGICTAGGMHPGSENSQKGSATLNFTYGVGEQNVKILTPQIEGTLRLNSKSTIQVKLPFVFASGNIGNNNGLGDIISVINYRFYDKDEKKIAMNFGVRIGVNNANKFKTISSDAGINSLPMPYQPSLGTTDLLIGADFKYKEKWLFALGFQMPIIQYNYNHFDTTLINASASQSSESAKYFSSYNLHRAPDVVIRADRTFKVSEKLSFAGGLLGIYHLLHDRTTSPSGVESAISGSKGLTLNVPISTTYQFNKVFSITLRYATPLIVREVRPDGLTRKYVVGLEMRYSF